MLSTEYSQYWMIVHMLQKLEKYKKRNTFKCSRIIFINIFLHVIQAPSPSKKVDFPEKH